MENSFFDLNSPEILWFLAGLIFLVLEIAGPGFFLFFLGIGAWLTSIVCYFFPETGLGLQLLVFSVSSVSSLLLLRNRLKDIFEGKSENQSKGVQMDEGFVGQKAIVLSKVGPKYQGRVELHGSSWKAESDIDIEAGETVEVTEKQNLTLKVKHIN